MNNFKNTIITCHNCNKLVMVKVSDFNNGKIQCSHGGCGYVNILSSQSYYDSTITNYLDEFGKLVYISNPSYKYFLKLGKNVIGVGNDCEVQLNRFIHNNKCFISRRHTTIEVTLDKWTGLFRYRVQDGAIDYLTNQHKKSLNGTKLNNLPLKESEMIDIPNKGIINIGGMDEFELIPAIISEKTLATYKINMAFDADNTQ